jgi:hypothetical protein
MIASGSMLLIVAVDTAHEYVRGGLSRSADHGRKSPGGSEGNVLRKLGEVSFEAVSTLVANPLEVGEQWVMLTHKEIEEVLTGGESCSDDSRRRPR